MSNTNIKQQLLTQVASLKGINKLKRIMQILRDPQHGCPWDVKQTYDSIVPHTIEEVYEVVEAIEKKDFANLKEELGDLLLQIVFYAQIADEEKRFDFDDIAQAISDKLVERHPHVFANEFYEDEETFYRAWEEKKQIEREKKAKGKASLLDDIPAALPELKRAQKIQKRVAKVGFDWPSIKHVWDKINEECQEVRQAEKNQHKPALEEEIGDLFFALVNLSRHHKIDADLALRKANQKFEKRFRWLEESASSSLADMPLREMDELWDKAKQALR